MNKIKNSFKEIKVTKELENNILNLTVNKKKRNSINLKWAYALSMTIIICLVSTSIVYAKEIKEAIKKWSTSISIDGKDSIKFDGNFDFIKIPNSALKSESREQFSFDEVEKMLNINLLNLENNNPNVYYDTGLNAGGSIGRVDLWIPEFIKNKNFKTSLLISMLNESADDGYISAFNSGLDAYGDKKIIETYQSKNLNTQVILYKSDHLNATFVYNNVLYQLAGEDITQEYIMEIIENLK